MGPNLIYLYFIFVIHAMLFEVTYCQPLVFNTSLGAIDDDPFVYESKAQAVRDDVPVIREWTTNNVI